MSRISHSIIKETKQSEDPAAQNVCNLSSLFETATLNKSKIFYQNLLDVVSICFEQAKHGKPFGLTTAVNILNKAVKDTDVLESLCRQVTCEYSRLVSFIIPHMVNVAIISMKIGREFEFLNKEMLLLGIAALIHDIGIAGVPDEILSKPGPLTENERTLFRKAFLSGQDIIKKQGRGLRYIAEFVSQIRERNDGMGYPNKLKKDEIKNESQIIGIAECYEAITHNRPHRTGMSPHEGIKKIVSLHNSGFSLQIKKALVKALSPFPPNSLIKLNTGAIGKVISIQSSNLMRPLVEIIIDTQGPQKQGKRINLAHFPLINIIGPIVTHETQ